MRSLLAALAAAALGVLSCQGAGSKARPPASVCGTPGAAWQRCPSNPVVLGWQPGPTPGELEWTMADPSILWDPEDGLWKAWWSSVVADSCADLLDPARRTIEIFHAESRDGLAWTIQADPALSSHLDARSWDDSTVETPSVMRLPLAPADRRYALVYAGGNTAQLEVLGQVGWQLGLAFSPDGRHFTRIPAAESPYHGQPTPFEQIDGLLLLGKDAFPGSSWTAAAAVGVAADPELALVGDTYHLWFGAGAFDAGGQVLSSADRTRAAYGISHATSTDLVHWTVVPDENPVLMGAGQATVVEDQAEGKLHMWYSQDDSAVLESTVPSAVFPTLGFFHATSDLGDGVRWATETGREFSWDPSVGTERLGLLNGPAVVRSGDEYRLYYGAWGDVGVPAGSCAYVWQDGVIAATPGVYGLSLATRKAP